MESVTKLWIWLSLSCTPEQAWRALRHFESVERLYQAGPEELSRVAGLWKKSAARLCDKSSGRAERILSRCEALGMYLLCWDGEDYPDRLREMALPPMVLYCWGQRISFQERCVIAMAGSRTCSAYGRAMADYFAAHLTKRGALVLTGMASGCDEASLRGALRVGGPVAALLPGGVDVPFEDNDYYRSLYRDVRDRGVLISPYPPGTRNDHRHFFYRNPILTALSAATLCVEAGPRSGVLNVAANANEQGRTVYVVPANLDVGTAAGTNALMCAGLALPVMSAEDILLPFRAAFPSLRLPESDGRRKKARKAVSLVAAPTGTGTQAKKAPKKPAPEPPEQAPKPEQAQKGVDSGPEPDYIDVETGKTAFTEQERSLLRALREGDKSAEELSALTGLDSALTLSALTLLTLRGAVEENQGGRFQARVRLREEE